MNFSDLAKDDGLFCDGDWIEKKDQDPTGTVRLIQLADIGVGEFKNRSNKFVNEDTAKRLNCTRLQQGDILIARLPDPLGRACIFPLEGDFITAVDVAILRLSSNAGTSNKYIMHLINSPQIRAEIRKYESGTTRKRISRKNLDRIQLQLPSPSEQQCIVARIEELFSQLDSGVETLLKGKQQLAVYRQAVLKEAFEGCGERVPFGEITTSCLGKMLDKEKNQGTPRKYLRNINVRWFAFDESDLLEMRIDDNEIKRYSIKKGDLVVCEGGEPGRCAVWAEDRSIFFQKALHRVRFNEPSNPKFYMYYFWFMAMSGALAQYYTGTGIKHLTGESLKKVLVPLADLEQQNAVVEKIESQLSVCDSIEQTVDAALQQAEALRQSILKQAFKQ